jgi:hypothetical protein
MAISQAAILYVSTEGRAAWSGKLAKPNAQGTDGPLPSLAAARDKIRELRRGGAQGPVTVLVRGGTYFLEEPFVLAPEDSGTKGQPVTYAAYPRERAVLSGGRRISGWTKKDNRLWTAPAWFEFHQLFVTGKRTMRARTPNQGFYRDDGLIAQLKPMAIKFRGNDIQKSWAERGDVEAAVLCAWQEVRGRITAVDEAAHTATFAGIAPLSAAARTQRDCCYWIENAPDSLDFPGEWYLDRKAGVVMYW